MLPYKDFYAAEENMTKRTNMVWKLAERCFQIQETLTHENPGGMRYDVSNFPCVNILCYYAREIPSIMRGYGDLF
ncbi:hypothetical protein SUGI_0603140 [Cryptomeria japonica]|nr:hypothetical protein SUGI_0603140 [Cryptomeria japonica]